MTRPVFCSNCRDVFEKGSICRVIRFKEAKNCERSYQIGVRQRADSSESPLARFRCLPIVTTPSTLYGPPACSTRRNAKAVEGMNDGFGATYVHRGKPECILRTGLPFCLGLTYLWHRRDVLRERALAPQVCS